MFLANALFIRAETSTGLQENNCLPIIPFTRESWRRTAD